jgi:hypothetical protein
VGVPAGRLARWVQRFVADHGRPAVTVTAEGLVLLAPDGTRAEVVAGITPWTPTPRPGSCADPAQEVDDLVASLVGHLLADRVAAVLLVRRGGYAAAVLVDGRIAVSKVGSRYVQGRTAAGGWSQQRFARRRDKQTDELVGAAADVSVRVWSTATGMELLVTGGDRPLVDRVLRDPRLKAIAALPRARHLAVGDPRADVLRSVPDLVRSVRIRLTGEADRRG